MPQNNNHIPTQPEPESPFPELDVRSEDVQEIIGRPPHGLVRWGVTGFFGVLALVLIAASVIRYPEVVRAPLIITAIDAPKTLEARTGGKIVRLLAENNEQAKKGQVLAWMESTAGHRQVLRLSVEIDSLRNRVTRDDIEHIENMELASFVELGEIQPAFQGFELAWREYISEIPVRDSLFFARVEFPSGLVTNYGREIPPRNGMTGQAEIITRDMRLLQRVYNNITKELR